MQANNVREVSKYTDTERIKFSNEIMDISVFRACYGNSVKPGSNELDLGRVEAGTASGRQMEQLEKVINLLQRLMSIFGIYILHLEEPENKRAPPVSIFGKLLCGTKTKQNICRTAMLVFLVLYTVRSFLSFFIGEKSPKYLIIRVCSLVWSIQVTGNVVLMLKASHKKFGNQIKACKWCFKNVMPLIEEQKTNVSTKSVRQKLIAAILVGLIFVIFNIVSVSFFVLFEKTSFHEVLIAASVSPLPTNIATKLIAVVWNAYASVALMLSMIYVISWNTILKYLFELSCQAFSNAITNKQETQDSLKCLYRQRTLHLNISKTVALFDKDFSYFFANWFSTNIPIACLILYQIAKYEDMETFTLMSYVFWFVANILPVSITATFAALTQDAAHSVLEYIHDVGTERITLEELGQLTLFLSKLNGSPIGFTVLNLVTLTKELLLTIGGLYLTYFFVLWQFV